LQNLLLGRKNSTIYHPEAFEEKQFNVSTYQQFVTQSVVAELGRSSVEGKQSKKHHPKFSLGIVSFSIWECKNILIVG